MPYAQQKSGDEQLKRKHIQKCIDDLRKEKDRIPHENLSNEVRQDRLSRIHQEISQLRRELKETEHETQQSSQSSHIVESSANPSVHFASSSNPAGSEQLWENDVRAAEYLRNIDLAMEDKSETAKQIFGILKLLVRGARGKNEIEEKVMEVFALDSSEAQFFMHMLPEFPRGDNADNYFERLQILLAYFNEAYTYFAGAEWTIANKHDLYQWVLDILHKSQQ